MKKPSIAPIFAAALGAVVLGGSAQAAFNMSPGVGCTDRRCWEKARDAAVNACKATGCQGCKTPEWAGADCITNKDNAWACTSKCIAAPAPPPPPTPAALSKMTADEFAKLKPADFRAFTADHIAALKPAHYKALTAEQFKALSDTPKKAVAKNKKLLSDSLRALVEKEVTAPAVMKRLSGKGP